jgi:hypothetical protein
MVVRLMWHYILQVMLFDLLRSISTRLCFVCVHEDRGVKRSIETAERNTENASALNTQQP